MTAGLIKSYKKLSPLIWHDLKVGIMNNLLPKDLLPQIRAAHPLAQRVRCYTNEKATDLVFKNAIQKIKRELRSASKSLSDKNDLMKIKFLVD
jgi:hypothetical protein